MGHLGGAIAGLFLGIVILRNLEKKKCEKVVWWCSLIIYLIFIIICAILVATDVSF